MMPRVFLWPAVVLWEGPPRRQRICATLLLALAMSPIYAGGQVATGEASLSADARPSRVRVLGGSFLGGLAFSGGVGLAVFAATGGTTDCYEGGCLTLSFAALAWPVGSVWGAGRVMGNAGFRTSFVRLTAVSVLGTGLAILSMFAVDQAPRSDPECTSDGFCIYDYGPPDAAYVIAGLDRAVLRANRRRI